MPYKIFDRVWIKVGNKYFPAAIWGIDQAKKVIDENGNVIDQLVDILITINGICLPRSVFLSKIIDAREDCDFTFSTKTQLQDVTQVTQGPSNKRYELL